MTDESHSTKDRVVDQYRGRLSRMEAMVESLASSVERQAKAQAEHQAQSAKLQAEFQRDIRADVREFQKTTQKAIEGVVDKVSQHGRVSWPLVTTIVFGVATSFLGSLTLVISVGVLSLAPVRKDIDRNTDALSAHESIDGHPEAMKLHAKYEERFETIRTDLSHLREAVRANAADLDSRAGLRFNRPDWQRQYDTVIAPLIDDVREIQATRFRDSDGSGVIERIARLEEQIKALGRQ